MEGIFIPNVAAEIQRGIAEGLATIRTTIREEIAATLTPPPTTTQGYYSRDEVRRLLHVSATTLHTWEKNRNLVPVRIGRRVLYPIADVEAAMKGGK
jgi:hypothetical protein